MPIKDYTKEAARDKELILNDKNISEKNRQYLQRFFKAYDVSPARLGIFCRHIKFLLYETDDVCALLNDRDKVNIIFEKLRKKISKSYYGTLINVTNTFVRWLNEGIKPKGFIDLKSPSKYDMKRSLSRDDMLTWEDIDNISKQSTSIQMQSVPKVAGDLGPRPSEFVDLNYGDVEIKKDIVIFHIRKGKTGERYVPCIRCVPTFLRWYNAHPTKKKDDPLWIMENTEKSHIKGVDNKVKGQINRYKYSALVKRVRKMAKKAGINKPTDFYNFRHSSCYLDKMDNVPIDLAAERHGHSVDFYTNIYGRLDATDKANRLSKHYGGEEEEKNKRHNNLMCDICSTPNEPDSEFCIKCGKPLSLKVALDIDKKKEEDIDLLKKQMKDMKADILNSLVDNPEVLRRALKIAEDKLK